MRRVFLETPYAGDVTTNLAYARACAADCIRRGEAPFASHLLYTQDGILDDNIPEERTRGIEAGQAFLEVCTASVVYIDRGISGGMQLGIEAAGRLGIPVELRRLDPAWERRTVFSGPGRWVPIEEKLPGDGWRVEVVQRWGRVAYPARFKDGVFRLDSPLGQGEVLPEGWVGFWRGSLAVRPDGQPQPPITLLIIDDPIRDGAAAADPEAVRRYLDDFHAGFERGPVGSEAFDEGVADRRRTLLDDVTAADVDFVEGRDGDR